MREKRYREDGNHGMPEEKRLRPQLARFGSFRMLFRCVS